MKHIELKQLSLTNYRNIAYDTLQFEGDSIIGGENRIGKTNTLEAIVWLLTDKLLNGGNDITQLKPLDDTKKEVVVKGTFLVSDDNEAKTYTLKKEYKEQWRKTRGTTERVMDGHTTTYYINDVKYSAMKNYLADVIDFFGLKDATIKSNIDFNQMLTNPFYLGDMGETLSWTNLRAFIIELVGDVADKDVFALHPEYSPIQDDLTKVSGKFDLAKKLNAQNIATMKNQIIGDEAKVSAYQEVKRPTDEEIAIAKKGVEDCDTNIANLKNQNGIDVASQQIEKELVGVREKITETREKILKLPNPKQERIDKLSQSANEKYEEIDRKVSEKGVIVNEISKIEMQIKNDESQLAFGKNKRLEYIQQLKDLDAKRDAEINSADKVCPVCHKPYTEEEIQIRNQNLTDYYEKEKSKVIALGKANTTLNSNFEKSLEESNKKLVEKKNELSKIETEIDKLHEEHCNLTSERNDLIVNTDVNDNPYKDELQSYISKRDELEKQLDESRASFARGCQDINSRIYEEESKKEPFKKVLADYDYYTRSMQECEKARNVLSQHENDLADLEQKKDLFISFIRTKLDMLDSNVAKVFGNIKFQLIKENVNGGYDAICKPYIYDIENQTSTTTTWKSGSKSERVITGIAIAEAIKSKLELPDLPYLFDEGGEISADTFSKKFKTNAQLICVKVMDNIMKPTIFPISKN